MKNPIPILLPMILVMGACASPAPEGDAALSAEPSAAILVPSASPRRRELYAILTAGPCQQRLFSLWTQKTQVTPVFQGDPAAGLEVRVKPDVPVTLSYSSYISNESCVVAGTVLFRPGRRYTVRGAARYSGSLLPSFTGCELQVIDEETKQAALLFPPLVRPDFTMCEPQK